MAKARLKALLGRRRRDEQGATLIITAITMVALLGAGAMGVDLGFSVYGSRQAQAMADTAALDVVQNIGTADSQSTSGAVQTYLNNLLAGVDTDNGSNAGLSVTPGWWLNGVFTAQTVSTGCAGTVFSTTPPPCNAVQVSATQSVPQPFWGGFSTLTGHSGQSTVAAWTPAAGFSIGSYLATINTQQSAVLNVLLGALGTSGNVTILGYQGLANTYVTVSQLITASGGLLTNSNVMTASLPAQDWQTIWTAAVGNQVAQTNCTSSPLLCNAQTALSGLGFGTSLNGYAQLCQMVSINGSTCSNGTLPTSALSANLNALQTLTTEAELANGNSALNVASALNITGVASASLYLHFGQPPQLAYGPVGSYTSAAQCPAPTGQTSTCATTTQLWSDLQLTLQPIVGLPTQVLDITLSGATGTATLSQVNCTNNVLQTVKINVDTSAATGNVSLNGANIATASVNGVTNKAGTYSVVPPNSTTVSGATNPRNFGTTTPSITVSGLGLVPSLVGTVLSTAQGALGPVLQATGFSVGGAQVAATSADCDDVSIVK
jgi:uncharacterized membrane protein